MRALDAGQRVGGAPLTLLSPSAPEGKPIHRQTTSSSGTPATHGRSRSAGGLAIAITIDRRSSRLPIARRSHPVPEGFGEADLKPMPCHAGTPSSARLWSTGRTSAWPRILELSLSSSPTRPSGTLHVASGIQSSLPARRVVRHRWDVRNDGPRLPRRRRPWDEHDLLGVSTASTRPNGS
jgi:hypothetical protein